MWSYHVICGMPYKDVTIHSDHMLLLNGRSTSWCRNWAKAKIIVYMPEPVSDGLWVALDNVKRSDGHQTIALVWKLMLTVIIELSNGKVYIHVDGLARVTDAESLGCSWFQRPYYGETPHTADRVEVLDSLNMWKQWDTLLWCWNWLSKRVQSL